VVYLNTKLPEHCGLGRGIFELYQHTAVGALTYRLQRPINEQTLMAYPDLIL